MALLMHFGENLSNSGYGWFGMELLLPACISMVTSTLLILQHIIIFEASIISPQSIHGFIYASTWETMQCYSSTRVLKMGYTTLMMSTISEVFHIMGSSMSLIY